MSLHSYFRQIPQASKSEGWAYGQKDYLGGSALAEEKEDEGLTYGRDGGNEEEVLNQRNMQEVKLVGLSK